MHNHSNGVMEDTGEVLMEEDPGGGVNNRKRRPSLDDPASDAKKCIRHLPRPLLLLATGIQSYFFLIYHTNILYIFFYCYFQFCCTNFQSELYQ